VIASAVLCIAHNSDPYTDQLALSDPDSCPMFDRWRRLRNSGISVDCSGILRSASVLPHFKDSVLDLSGFETISVIGPSDRVLSQLYQQRINEALTLLKDFSRSRLIE
jgi:hypothetical protein